MDGVERLYQCFGVLADAEDKAGEFVEEYQSILNSVTGSNGEKKLCTSFIPRFFKYFPDEHLNALNCLLDLCEDEDATIRRSAIKALPSLCHEEKEHLVKIADVLTQLLQTGDTFELSIVQNALKNLIKLDPKGAVVGMFSQILAGDEETREHAIDFLKRFVVDLIPSVFHPNAEAETTLAEEIHKAMPDVTGEEFKVFVDILSKLKILSTEQKQLVDLITEQAELDGEIQCSDTDALEKFITCCRLAVQFFQQGADAQRFFKFIVEKILPEVDEINVAEEAGDLKLELLKLLAELSTYKVSDDELKSSVEPIFNKLLHYMPLPVANEEKVTDGESEPESQIEFSYVECLMYAFHQVGRKVPEFLTGSDAAERLRDFKLRLQYVGQRCQVYIKQLKVALSDSPSAKDEENKLKVIALRTTSNIHALIKDLFHSPPSYTNHVTLSWIFPKNTVNSEKTASSTKQDSALDERRKRAGITPITFESNSPARKNLPGKKQKTEFYLPPGRRSGANNGALEGQTVPGRFQRGGNRGFRGRRGRRGWRGNDRGWRW